MIRYNKLMQNSCGQSVASQSYIFPVVSIFCRILRMSKPLTFLDNLDSH